MPCFIRPLAGSISSNSQKSLTGFWKELLCPSMIFLVFFQCSNSSKCHSLPLNCFCQHLRRDPQPLHSCPFPSLPSNMYMSDVFNLLTQKIFWMLTNIPGRGKQEIQYSASCGLVSIRVIETKHLAFFTKKMTGGALAIITPGCRSCCYHREYVGMPALTNLQEHCLAALHPLFSQVHPVG